MADPIKITVYGTAKPAGSKRAFAHKTTGRIIVTDDNPNSRDWKNDVKIAALAAMQARTPLDGPLDLTVTFYLPRPKGHYGKRGLLPSARAYPTTKPDTTKLLRGLEDALTGICWRDDAQVVQQRAYKRYGEPARAEVLIWPLPDMIGEQAA